MSPFPLTNIFQDGWNHQPGIVFVSVIFSLHPEDQQKSEGQNQRIQNIRKSVRAEL